MLDGLTEIALDALGQPASRRARTRAEIVAMLAVIDDSGIDPESTAKRGHEVEKLLGALFAG